VNIPFRIIRITAMTPEAICTGTAILISFLTPASDVKVDAPVKFIARNEEIPERRKNIIGVMKIEYSIILPMTMIDEITAPRKNPLKEKLRKKRNGSRSGVKTIPETYPARIMSDNVLICSDAWRNEIPSALTPERIKKNTRSIPRYRRP